VTATAGGSHVAQSLTLIVEQPIEHAVGSTEAARRAGKTEAMIAGRKAGSRGQINH
jgi:hypothetical protein